MTAPSAIIPTLCYHDVRAAMTFLQNAFGFETRMQIPGPDGSVMHAEMSIEDSMIMMSPTADGEVWASPKSLQGRVTQGLYVYVDDVDAHFARTRSAGAKIVAEPETMFWGDRTYVAEDLEGHRWTFATPVKEVAPEDMQPPS